MGEADDLDERMANAVEVEEMGRWWLEDCLGGILLHLDLLDTYRDALAVRRVDNVMLVENELTVPGKRL